MILKLLTLVITCQQQEKCLAIWVSDMCDAEGKVTLCLVWIGGGDCEKDAMDKISHSCPVFDDRKYIAVVDI